MKPQAEEFNENGGITRAKVPVSGVSVPAHMGVGSDLVDGIDYVVLLQVLFDVTSGMDVTPLRVWERLKERGIRSTKNREELVGKNSVYESFTRIIAAGYLLRVELPNEKHPGRKGRIAYRLYDNPAWNPDWQARQVGSDPLKPSEKSQVRTRSGTRELVDGEVGRPGKAAGQNASRNQGSGYTSSPVPGRGGRRVPAGQNASPIPGRIEPSPPHPPEGGGGTPPPNPRNKGRAPKADRYAEQCALTADDYQPTTEEIRAADAFLQDLPGKWQMGPDEARALAPLLASRAHTQGYEFDTFLELVLVQDDADKPATRPSRVMPYRVRNLKRRRVEEKPLPGAQAASGGLVEWCGVCNVGERPAAAYQRTRELPDGRDVPCPECHPKFARA
ncbi:hypothetical protein [Streptomyces sp. rh34]|uniref:hypothetical protein n=1 Tax=Streptomyces sp. rh34 TaxID=2034272 RepID=UPI0015CF5227|nr:hypothetical protein [Streptomyces sp. rh34]